MLLTNQVMLQQVTVFTKVSTLRLLQYYNEYLTLLVRTALSLGGV